VDHPKDSHSHGLPVLRFTTFSPNLLQSALIRVKDDFFPRSASLIFPSTHSAMLLQELTLQIVSTQCNPSRRSQGSPLRSLVPPGFLKTKRISWTKTKTEPVRLVRFYSIVKNRILNGRLFRPCLQTEQSYIFLNSISSSGSGVEFQAGSTFRNADIRRSLGILIVLQIPSTIVYTE